MEIESWIINWLEDNAGIEKDEILKKNEENYLELGWIDSLKFISFITDIEETFKIRFSNDVFQDDDGLIYLIDRDWGLHILERT